MTGRLKEVVLEETPGPAGAFLRALHLVVTGEQQVKQAEKKAIAFTKKQLRNAEMGELLDIRKVTGRTLEAFVMEQIPVGWERDLRWYIGLLVANEMMDKRLGTRGKQMIY